MLMSDRLGYVDLHVIDEIAVPDRFEQAVGEAEREDVLGRLLAEEVVDAEDLFLVEDLVQLAFSVTALSKSVPKGFSMTTLERSTMPASPTAGPPTGPRGWHAQVVHSAALPPERYFCRFDRHPQGV